MPTGKIKHSSVSFIAQQFVSLQTNWEAPLCLPQLPQGLSAIVPAPTPRHFPNQKLPPIHRERAAAQNVFNFNSRR
jgi:hypothetical protein